jgi:dTDP-4-amino-4,6-dideoxygalactose transaminase
LRPYLERLDGTRHYSNFGELSAQLTTRLAEAFRLHDRELVLANSGTAALIGAILASAGRASQDRPFCLLPSYTFCATALAAELCGFAVHIVDASDNQWALNPSELLSHPLLAKTGLVIPVSPYGARIATDPWQLFREVTGIPVVIDAAAGFEQVRAASLQVPRSVPLVLSFHATKAFSTGEGGAVLCRDGKLIESIYRALNFGMLGDRACRTAGLNGKMSEYHAAVGLAELDAWQVKASAFRSAAAAYRRAGATYGIGDRLITSPEVASCYVLFRAADEDHAAAIRSRLAQARIDHRLWYGRGLHAEPYYANLSRDLLPVTERLAPTIIGLPMATDLAEDDAERVVRTLASVAD